MNSQARRAKLLLLRALEAGGKVDLYMVPSGLYSRGTIQAPGSFVVSEIDQDGSGAFVVSDIDGEFGGQRVALPLDDVAAVWRGLDGRWSVRITGRLETLIDDSDQKELVYVPPETFVVSPVAKSVEDLTRKVGDIAKGIRATFRVEHWRGHEPSEQEIAEVAHIIWERRVSGGLDGTAEADWHRAKIRLREMTGR